MQNEHENAFPRTESFERAFGIPYTSTIKCVNSTVDSWKRVAKKMHDLKPSLHLKIYPHSIANEYLVENSFGFSMRKGQGHLQNIVEYGNSKTKHELNFQMKMCNTPFHQYEKIKLRDKGYQEINPALKSKLNLNDLKKIYSANDKPQEDEEEETEPMSPSDEATLQAFYRLAKSVPRQTNRCRWRATSEKTPRSLEKNNLGIIKVNDIVFIESVHRVLFLIVQKETTLVNVTKTVSVKQLNDDQCMEVPVEKLLTHRGKIFILPEYLYEAEGTEINVSEAVKSTFAHVFDSMHSSALCDEDWAALFQLTDSTNIEQHPNTSSDQPGPVEKLFEPSRKRKRTS